MARYIDPSCRQCRRIGEKLYLKGERCLTPRCAIERRNKPPGEHMPRRRRTSDWALQLREKQKARWSYGILERQFRKYFENAREQRGITGDLLLQQLETRLDNVVYRLSFSDSRKQGRQFVSHGHFQVNGKKLNVPSYQVKPNDIIGWKESGDSLPEFAQALTEGSPNRPIPGWLRLDTGNMTGQVLSIPDISEIESGIDARLIVEFYSR